MPKRKAKNARRENASDVKEYAEKLVALRTAIDDGDASGVARGDVFARIRRTLSSLAKRGSA
jgi:hypothetical protein